MRKTVKTIYRKGAMEVRVGIDGPVRILESSYHLISIEPLVGVLECDVDNGFVALSMNRAVALQLREVLDMFLAEKLD